MPKIPDFQSLGPEPTPTPQRGVYGAQTGQIEQADAEQAQVIGKVGSELGDFAAQREEAFTKLQTAQAASHLLMARANAIDAANQNPDYNSIKQNYADTMATVLPQISGNIQNNAARSIFEANAQEHIVDGQLNHIDHIIQTKRMDAGKASVMQSYNAGIQVASSADPSSVDALIFGNQKITQNARDAGLITAVEKEELDNKFPQEVAKAQLLKKIETDPAGAVQTLRGSITGTSTQAAIQNAAAANPGVSADYLSRTAKLESSGNPNASNGASKGLMGFMPDTAKQYGITDPNDPQQAANGAASLAKDNSAALTKSLGRAPSDSELYLAHQQGASGAAALLNNPNEKAVDALSDVYGDKTKAAAAITGNGGSTDMTAKQFSDMWAKKYDAAGSGTPADALPMPERVTLLRAAEAEHLRQYELQQRQIKDQQDSTMKDMLGKAETSNLSVADILSNKSLTFEQQDRMINVLHTVAERGAQTDPQTLVSLVQRIHAPDGSPDKITDPEQLIPFIGHGLSFDDHKKLAEDISGKNSPEEPMRVESFKIVKNMLSGADEGMGIKDPKGEELYGHALPMLYDAIKAGKAKHIPIGELYDPESPNWIGNGVKSLKRPDAQWYSDLNGANGAGGSVNASTPEGLVAAVKSGKISRSDGEALALKNGWIRPNAPAVPLAGGP